MGPTPASPYPPGGFTPPHAMMFVELRTRYGGQVPGEPFPGEAIGLPGQSLTNFRDPSSCRLTWAANDQTASRGGLKTPCRGWFRRPREMGGSPAHPHPRGAGLDR